MIKRMGKRVKDKKTNTYSSKENKVGERMVRGKDGWTALKIVIVKWMWSFQEFTEPWVFYVIGSSGFTN